METKDITIIALIVLAVYLYYQSKYSANGSKIQALKARIKEYNIHFEELIKKGVENDEKIFNLTKVNTESRELKNLKKKCGFLEKNLAEIVEVYRSLIEQNKNLKKTVEESQQKLRKKDKFLEEQNKLIKIWEESYNDLSDKMRTIMEKFMKKKNLENDDVKEIMRLLRIKKSEETKEKK